MVVFACGREFHIPVKAVHVNNYEGNNIYYLQSNELIDFCEKIFFCSPIAIKLSKNIFGDTYLIVEYEDGCFRLRAQDDLADAL